MDTNNLMIKDLVQIYHRNATYSDIHESYHVKGIKKEGIIVDGFDGAYKDEYVHPISLTAEMINANGFKENQWEFYDGYHFELSNKGIVLTVSGLWFVHELQHALRLCGLNEMADNFKVNWYD